MNLFSKLTISSESSDTSGIGVSSISQSSALVKCSAINLLSTSRINEWTALVNKTIA